jgi:hypothetical protein
MTKAIPKTTFFNLHDQDQQPNTYPHQSNREDLLNSYHLRQSSGRTPAAFSSKTISLLENLKLSFPMFPSWLISDSLGAEI